MNTHNSKTLLSLALLVSALVLVGLISKSNTNTTEAQTTGTAITCSQDTDNTLKNEANSYKIQGSITLADGSSLQDVCATDIDASSRTLLEYACDNGTPVAQVVTCSKTLNSCNLGRCQVGK